MSVKLRPTDRHWDWVPVWCLLLILPSVALARATAGMELSLVGICALGLSAVAFAATWFDKRQAEAKRPRIPEVWLHGAALCGGWPGALAARQLFRHKTAKPAFRIVSALIIALHQLTALDYLLAWRMGRWVLQAAGG